jgi:hypothetical protein
MFGIFHRKSFLYLWILFFLFHFDLYISSILICKMHFASLGVTSESYDTFYTSLNKKHITFGLFLLLFHCHVYVRRSSLGGHLDD